MASERRSFRDAQADTDALPQYSRERASRGFKPSEKKRYGDLLEP